MSWAVPSRGHDPDEQENYRGRVRPVKGTPSPSSSYWTYRSNRDRVTRVCLDPVQRPGDIWRELRRHFHLLPSRQPLLNHHFYLKFSSGLDHRAPWDFSGREVTYLSTEKGPGSSVVAETTQGSDSTRKGGSDPVPHLMRIGSVTYLRLRGFLPP